MATVLLVIVYITFISLGLPDAVLGAGWPVMQAEFGTPYSLAGIAHFMIAGGTIVSSLFTGHVVGRFGTGKVTAFSVTLTAIALAGFSIAPSFAWLLLAAIPLGLGAGAVDAGLNAFVAAHYESRHMSWLHCFWGVGAFGGPLILSMFLSRGVSWRTGYRTIGILQAALMVVLVAAIPLWAKVRVHKTGDAPHTGAPPRPFFFPFRLRGFPWTLATFLFYCGIESTMGLWGGSFLFRVKEFDAASAARWVSIYYASITIGRFITGFATYHVSNAALIRAGTLTIVTGILLMLAPVPGPFTLAGFVFLGMGCAPIFPCLLHETPIRFGKDHAATLMGFQMAVAYVGSTLLPPLFGFIASSTTLALLPAVLLTYACLMGFGSERVRWLCRRDGGA